MRLLCGVVAVLLATALPISGLTVMSVDFGTEFMKVAVVAVSLLDSNPTNTIGIPLDYGWDMPILPYIIGDVINT